MVDKRHKQALYEQLARIGKATAAPRRLELIDLLGQAPRTVEGLADQTGMSVANTSRHLQVLRAAGLVESTKDGLFVTYRLTTNDVADFFVRLRTLAEARLTEIERLRRKFFADDGDLEGLGGKDLLELVRRRQVILLDVRPSDEYEAGHIQGARGIPLSELKQRLAELPRDRRIVAYCRGPYCVFAVDAVKLLSARGFVASRLEAGVPEWRARRLPVEVSAAASRRAAR